MAVIGRPGRSKDALCKDELVLFAEDICFGWNFFTHNSRGEAPSSKVGIRDWYMFMPTVHIIGIDSQYLFMVYLPFPLFSSPGFPSSTL